MIRHIIGKDWKLLWPLVILVAVFQFLLGWLSFRWGYFGGDLIARTSVGKQRISSPLVVAGDLLLVFGDGGELNALRAAALVPK